MLEKTLKSPLNCKEIKTVHPTGNQSWVFIGRTDVEAETPILWPPDAESFEKALMLGRTQVERRRGHRRWDGWMASLTRWPWVLTGSRCWWWTGKPGVIQSMGSQRLGHDWPSELNLIALHTQFLKSWSKSSPHLTGVKYMHCQGYFMAPFLQRRDIISLLLFLLSSHNGKRVFKSVIFEASYNWICFHLLVILNKLLRFHKHPFFF